MDKKKQGLKAQLTIPLAFIAIILGAFVWNESLLYSQNNLFYNSHWESYKKNFYTSSAGDIYSLLSRTLLANNRLLTNKNLGHQLVFSREPILLKEVDFLVKIGKTGYLDVLYNYKNDHFEGLRISQSSSAGTMYYKAEISGKFVEKLPLKMSPLPERKIHIIVRQFGDIMYFYVNHQLVLKRPGTFDLAKIGFYTSLQDVEIFSVKGIDQSNQGHFLPFEREQNRSQFFGRNLLILLFLALAISAAGKIYSPAGFDALFLKASVFFFAGSLLWFSFDYCYYSKIPKVWNYHYFSFFSEEGKIYDLERARFNFFRSWYKFAGGEIPTENTIKKAGAAYFHPAGLRRCFQQKCEFLSEEKILARKKNGKRRIAFIAGSFADFAGIVKIEDSFFEKFGSEIARENKNTEVVNFVYSGIIFRERAESVLETMKKYKPDYVILSVFLANTDFLAFNEFVRNLSAENSRLLFYRPVNERDFFVPLSESVKTFGHNKEFRENKLRQTFWEDLKGRTDVKFIDAEANAFNFDLYGKGLVWWDANHMTAFGQDFMARDLAIHTKEWLGKTKIR